MKANTRVSKMIEPYRQLKFGLLFLLTNLIFSSLIIGTMIYFLWDIFSTMKIYFDLIGQEEALSFNQLLTPLSIVIFLTLSFIATTFYLSIRYTHKFYGPMLSIENHLEKMIQQEPVTPLRIRKEDELQGIAIKLNLLLKQRNDKSA